LSWKYQNWMDESKKMKDSLRGTIANGGHSASTGLNLSHDDTKYITILQSKMHPEVIIILFPMKAYFSCEYEC
jgi:hypothetical protein